MSPKKNAPALHLAASGSGPTSTDPPAAQAPYDFDELDRRIILLLADDGRMANNALAERLSVREQTVAERIRAMKNAGAMETTVLTDLHAFGFTRNTAVLLAVDPQDRAAAERFLVDLEAASSVARHRTYGHHDYLVHLVTRDEASHRSVLDRVLGDCPGLIRSDVQLGFDAYSISGLVGFRSVENGSAPLLPPESPETGIDRVDVAIVRELMDDGRRPFVSVAESLDLNETTVRRRVARLLEMRAVRFAPIVASHAFGLRWNASAWLRVRSAHLGPVTEQLARLPQVFLVASTAGPLGNVCVGLHGSGPDEVSEVLRNEVASLAGVVRMTTYEIEAALKSPRHWRSLGVTSPVGDSARLGGRTDR